MLRGVRFEVVERRLCEGRFEFWRYRGPGASLSGAVRVGVREDRVCCGDVRNRFLLDCGCGCERSEGGFSIEVAVPAGAEEVYGSRGLAVRCVSEFGAKKSIGAQ